MHLFIAVEGHSGAIRRFESDFDRRVYKGKGKNFGGDGVVKLGEIKFYDVRFPREAREDVLSDLKSIGFKPIEDVERAGYERTAKMKIGFFLKMVRWATRFMGIKKVRGWEKLVDKQYWHGLDQSPGPYRIGAGGYCMWKVVLGEKDDWFAGEQEQV